MSQGTSASQTIGCGRVGDAADATGEESENGAAAASVVLKEKG